MHEGQGCYTMDGRAGPIEQTPSDTDGIPIALLFAVGLSQFGGLVFWLRNLQYLSRTRSNHRKSPLFRPTRTSADRFRGPGQPCLPYRLPL